MKKRRTMLVALGMACMLAFSACGGAPQKEKEPVKQEETAKAWMFTDSAGREVEIPANVEKIAPSGPLAQMFLLSVAPEKLCGLAVDISEDAAEVFGEDCAKLPVFGALYGVENLNKEALAAAEPQLIIDIGDDKVTNKEDLDGLQEQLGIPTIFVKASLDTTAEAFKTLGKILGEEEQGNKLSAYCEEKLKMIKDGMAEIPEEERVNFLYAQGDNGLYVVSKDSFHAEVLDMLGNNVAVLDTPTKKGFGDEISGEKLLLWDPDVVILGPGSIYDTVKDDELWSQLSAIQNDRYYEVPNNPYNWVGMPPSVNRFMGMQWVANIFYPEVFDYDMYEATKEYYDLFYHYDLDKENYEELVKNAVK